MPSARAVVAEPDAEFCGLVAGVLELAGFQPSRCANGVQFRIELHSLLLPGVEIVLLVIADRILRADRAAVAAAAKTWMRIRNRRMLGVWTSDAGSADALAEIEGVELLSVLEKPFDLRELGRLAQGALIRTRPSIALEK
jgi:hypothetical protein